MVRRLLDSVRPESVHSVVSCSFRELQLRGSSASPPPWHVPHLLESGAVAVAKAAPDGRNSMARKHAPRSVRAYLAATNNTKATAQQTRRDRWNWRAARAPQPNALALVPMPPPPRPRPGVAAAMLALPPDPATQCSAPPGLLWSTVLPSYY